MSQSTLDPNLAPEASASEPAAGRQGNAPHRPPRSASHKAPPRPEQTAAATPAAATAEPVPAPEATVPAAPAATPPEASEQPRSKTTTRSRRRTPGGRKNDVQLVIPPTADGESAASADVAASAEAAPETQTPPAADVSVVPVTSEPAEPATPLASEPAGAIAAPTGAAATETTAPAPEASAAPEAAPRRYRFDRKATATPYSPASRPERLSGPLVLPPTLEPAAQAGEAAGARPSFPSTAYAPGELDDEATASDAIDDIVSALGLRNAPHREPLRLPVEPVAPATEEAEAPAEAEAETPSESEAEATTDATTAGTGRSKRPRRRRRGGAHAASAGEEDAEEMLATEPLAEPAPRPRQPRRPAASTADANAPTPITEPGHAERNGYEQYAQAEYGAEFEPPYGAYGRAERQPWDVTQGQSQIGQPESPFVSPDPSVVRGFGPQPRGVAGPARETFARTGRTERTDTPPMSSNQLATMVTHAIQQQTDRLLNEFRYHPQSPGMTVMLPALPSTERVGVFVDVANLHYSSRNMRITVDFGKLLEFLRGNRRLIRAHAYAPTNPDPRADQSFLDAVKGLGYRITTKNYKTFASGAKKADMDLDLCMDIVRMVDAGAVDTIVLVSGDSDFLPLLEYCSDHGVRVEVAAFEDAAAAILRQSCDLFVNLSLVNDIRM